MFGNLGATEIVLIVLAILILFGAKKIPELAQGIGKGMKEFKKAVKDVEDEINVDEKPESKRQNTRDQQSTTSSSSESSESQNTDSKSK
jgi:TatA/E family protein of Tat protein translocase